MILENNFDDSILSEINTKIEQNKKRKSELESVPQPLPLTPSPIPPILPHQPPPQIHSQSQSQSSSPQNPHAKKIENWDVRDVSKWMSSLSLSQKFVFLFLILFYLFFHVFINFFLNSYSEVIANNNINGEALLLMNKEDWKDSGVSKIGDLKILVAGTNKLSGI